MKTLRKTEPVTLKQIRIRDGFWGPRVRINRGVTLPIEYAQCRKTGRIDAWKLTWKPGDPNPPHRFWDSDLAKWIEAAAYSLESYPDPALEKKLDAAIDLMARAQRKDGYLNVHYTAVEPEMRWKNLRDAHELYSAGHLMEAAVAYAEARGKTEMLDVLCRYADYINSVFGTRKGQKRGYPGHQEIELALVKLYRATGRKRYLKLAKFFVDERGKRPHYFDIEAKARGDDPKTYRHQSYDYNQAHLPVRQQKAAEGHSVRACYLYAGMADVAAETNDRELLKACETIWRNITERRMYVHGGVGSIRIGERFTFDYDLPNEEAYAETCAAIALVFFAHRMLQINPDRRYADVMERALYNGVISGVSLDGKRFFYDNYLASQPGAHRFTGQKPPRRQEWFGCACCPPNIARLLSSLGLYFLSTSRSGVYLHLYGDLRAELETRGGRTVIDMKSNYPWSEKVRITVRPEQPASFTVALRIPAWCRKPALSVNGKRVGINTLTKGYAKVRREWKKGDRIELSLPMPPERVEAHPSVRHDCGRVALQRGPVVYCLEETDNGKNLNDIVLPREAKLTVKKDKALFGGIPVITARARRRSTAGWEKKLYRTARSPAVPAPLKAIPYFMWANRTEGEMLVWIRDG